MVREHELKLQHVKNLQKYYTEVLKTAPPCKTSYEVLSTICSALTLSFFSVITHAADVPGGLTEFSQEELKCPEPGCTRTFRRQKNLEEHLKHSHKPVSTSIEATSKLLSKPKGTPLRKLSTVKGRSVFSHQ